MAAAAEALQTGLKSSKLKPPPNLSLLYSILPATNQDIIGLISGVESPPQRGKWMKIAFFCAF